MEDRRRALSFITIEYSLHFNAGFSVRIISRKASFERIRAFVPGVGHPDYHPVPHPLL